MKDSKKHIELYEKLNEVLQEKVNLHEKIILEIGCGPSKKVENSITVDLIDYPDVDICGDIFEVMEHIPDSMIDEIFSSHFIEHISDLDKFMNELARILKEGGLVDVIAPHFSNPYYYSDATHKSFFGLYTFCYFSDSSIFSRSVPTYDNDVKFNLIKVDLCFKTDRTFFVRAGIKFILGKVFNLSSYTKELYEDTFCYIFPCYEIHAVLERK